MRRIRFRLKSLMMLILAAALGFALVAQLRRMQPIDFADIRERLTLLGMFLILVVAKLGLITAARWKRRPPEAVEDPRRNGYLGS